MSTIRVFLVLITILMLFLNSCIKPSIGYIKEIITADIRVAWFKGTIARDVIKPDYITLENIRTKQIDTIGFGHNIADVYLKTDSIIILIEKDREAGHSYYLQNKMIFGYNIISDTISSPRTYKYPFKYYEK